MSYLLEGIRMDATDVRGFDAGPEPMVPVEFHYPGGTMQTFALADTGTSRAGMPRSTLPDDVEWSRLPRVSAAISAPLLTDAPARDVRVWHVDLVVFGVRIAREIVVFGDLPHLHYPVLGREDLFSHFEVSFAWSNQPPLFALRPLGQMTALPDLKGAWQWDRTKDPRQLVLRVSDTTPRLSAGAGRPMLPPNRAQRRALAHRVAGS